MTDVACFCGCCFSFDGGAGACPRCGEVARVTAGAVPDSAGHIRPELQVPVMNRAGQNGQTPGTCPEQAEAGVGVLSGIAPGVAAGHPATDTERTK